MNSAMAVLGTFATVGFGEAIRGIWTFPVTRGDARFRLMDAATYQDFVFEIIYRSDKEPGFKVLLRRWVVERTFGWMTRWKRLVRDYEQRIDVSEAMTNVALGSLMLRGIVYP